MSRYTPKRVIYEFHDAGDGRHVRVAAMDEDTRVEARAICPQGVSEDAMRRLAFRKLEYIQNQKRDDDQNDGRGGIVV